MSSKPKSPGSKIESLSNKNKYENNIQHLHDVSSRAIKHSKNASKENLEIAKDLQNIIQRCSNLTEKEIWGYCKSQRYFMKLYLQKLSNE